jgi:hypothetical protein
MPVALNGLRRREIDVITAQEDNAATLTDSQLLDRATALNRPLYTQDDDLLVEAHKRQTEGRVLRASSTLINFTVP